jgi:hypothetical protein
MYFILATTKALNRSLFLPFLDPNFTENFCFQRAIICVFSSNYETTHDTLKTSGHFFCVKGKVVPVLDQLKTAP